MKNKQHEKLEFPVCNICASDEYSVVFDNMTYWEYKGVFRVVKCKNCGLVYTSPRPILSEIGKYYIQENYWGRDFSSGSQELYDDVKEREEAYGNVYKLILRHKKKGKIFDIGAGTGLFLSKFKELGWEVSGVEISSDAVKYAKKRYKIALKLGDIFDYKIQSDSYDVVVLNGALEHMYNPLHTLQLAHRILKKNGIVVFSVPNVDGVGKRIFGRNWFPWQLPRHLYHFSPATASKMLIKAKFKNVKVFHNYKTHNYYILFQSPRYFLSPKFKKHSSGGLVNKKMVSVSHFSIKKEVGKIVIRAFASIISSIEPLLQKSEVMLMYAKKTS